MKKYISIIFMFLFTLCGCENKLNNTPTRQAEIFLGKYQTLHQDVIDDLKDALNNENMLEDSDRENYINIMKKHYQDLEYEIKEEKIDGDKAIVTVQIEVYDYRNIDNKVKELYNDDYENNMNKYRLDVMKNTKDRIRYTIDLTFTKKDKKWVIDSLSNEVLDKINGVYNI